MKPTNPLHSQRGASAVQVSAGIAVIAALFAFPQFVESPYVLHMMILFFLSTLMGQSWNIIGGYTGQYSVGHAAYFGTGAYTAGLFVMHGGFSAWWGMAFGGVAAMLLGLPFGAICFPLRGAYFALASLALNLILMHLATIAERFTAELCGELTGCEDADALLDRAERANLFLVALDDRREWYRYHHLFADVLRARLLAEQPDLVPLLHQRASRWYEAHDFAEESVRHALAARDFDRAAYLMELAMPAIRRDRHEVILLGWLKALPDEIVRRSPVLSVFFGYMLMISGDLDAFEPRLDDAERALAAVPDASAPPWAQTEELRTLPATIALYRASLAQARGDVAGTAGHARRALDLAGPGDHLARGGAAGFLGHSGHDHSDLCRLLRREYLCEHLRRLVKFDTRLH